MSLKRNYLGIKVEYAVGCLSGYQRNIPILPMEGTILSLSLCFLLPCQQKTPDYCKVCLLFLSNCQCFLRALLLAGKVVKWALVNRFLFLSSPPLKLCYYRINAKLVSMLS